MPRFICFTYNGVSQICYITGDCKNASFPLFFYLIWLGRVPTFVHLLTWSRWYCSPPDSMWPCFIAAFRLGLPDMINSDCLRRDWLVGTRKRGIQMNPSDPSLSAAYPPRNLFLFYCFDDDQLVTFAVWLSTFCVFNSDNFSFFSIFSLSHHCFFLFSVSLTFGSEWGVCVCVCVRPRRRLKIYLSLSV